MAKNIILISLIFLAVVFSGCKKELEPCKAGEVRDMRLGGALASNTYSLCIPSSVAPINDDLAEHESGVFCNGVLVKDLIDPATGEEVKKCLSGCTKGNVVDDECKSTLGMGQKCNIIGDCKDSGAICFSDPMVAAGLVEQFSMLVKVDPSLQATLEALGHKKVTAELARTVLGFNYCTIMDCNNAGVNCPSGSECVDATLDTLGLESGLFVCKPKKEVPDEGGQPEPDTETSDEDVTPVDMQGTCPTAEYKCMINGDEQSGVCVKKDAETPDTVVESTCPDTCASHDECKIEGCENTFCTQTLKDAGLTTENVCVQRCEATEDCPEGLVCNTSVSMAEALGADIDGAKGICAPPDIMNVYAPGDDSEVTDEDVVQDPLKEIGEECSASSECTSDVCLNDPQVKQTYGDLGTYCSETCQLDTETPDTVVESTCPDTCASHDECKIEGCENTFCTQTLKDAGLTTENVCVQRCEATEDCPEGLVCNTNVSMAEALGADIDGAKGICAPPDTIVFK